MKESLQVRDFTVEAEGINYRITVTPVGDEREIYFKVGISGPHQDDTVELRIDPISCQLKITNRLLRIVYEDIQDQISHQIIALDL